MLTASEDHTARLWPVLPAGDLPPDWCGDFLVWLGGKQIAPDRQVEALSGDELGKLEARLRSHMNEDTDYGRLLRWHLLAPEQRPVDPYDRTTQEQAADLIIRPDMKKSETEHAYDLDPWHPLVHLALAGFEEDPIRADFLRRYFLDRLPNDPKLRQRATYKTALDLLGKLCGLACDQYRILSRGLGSDHKLSRGSFLIRYCFKRKFVKTMANGSRRGACARYVCHCMGAASRRNQRFQYRPMRSDRALR